MRVRAVVLAAVLFSTPAFAQEFKRSILQRVDVPMGVQHESVFGTGELPPGLSAGRHTHPGVEMLVLVEGEVEFTLGNDAPKRMKAGESMMVPTGTVHDVKNVGSGPAKIVSTWMVEKGKPMATPAPAK